MLHGHLQVRVAELHQGELIPAAPEELNREGMLECRWADTPLLNRKGSARLCMKKSPFRDYRMETLEISFSKHDF